MSAGTRKPDFSNVQGGFDGAPQAPAAKPAPDFSSVSGGFASNQPATPVDPSPAATRYTVVGGDSLSKIARKFYGKASLWPRIFEANRDTIADPDRIRVGQELVIPPPAAD